MASDRVRDAQYFKPNEPLLPQGPARINERADVQARHRAYQKVVMAARNLKDALVLSPQLDKSGNFDAALDHAVTMHGELNEAMRLFRAKGVRFLSTFEELDEDAPEGLA